MATYKVYFADSGVPSTDLTLTWETLTKVSDGSDLSVGAPAFTELAGGWYKFTYAPGFDAVGVIDGSATLTTDTDRYVPVDFSADDTNITFLDKSIVSLNDFDHANDTVARVTLTDTTTTNTDMRGTDSAATEAKQDAISARIPAALISGRISSDIGSVNGSTTVNGLTPEAILKDVSVFTSGDTQNTSISTGITEFLDSASAIHMTYDLDANGNRTVTK